MPERSVVGESPDTIKERVKKKYAEIAFKAGTSKQISCCGDATACCGDGSYSVFADDYTKFTGYVREADLGLGCGSPIDNVEIKPGNTVLDLGSGAGNDVFVVRSILGETGTVIGVDMTEAMVEKARENNAKLGFQNVEFVLGEIENLPLEANSVDVVISNCVLNLVPDKARAFSEISRVLRPGGRFSISDIVTSGELPEQIRAAAEMYAGCIAGALIKQHYIEIAAAAGFHNIAVLKEKQIIIPDETLRKFLDENALVEFKQSGAGIYSITLYGEKPTRENQTRVTA